MKNYKEFIAFLKKNRLIIYILFGVIMLMQVCSRGSAPAPTSKLEQRFQKIEKALDEVDLPIPQQEEPKKYTLLVNNLIFILIVVLLLFVAKRKGWIDKLIPPLFIFRVVHCKKKGTGEIVLKVFILNKTGKSVTVEAPSIEFFKGKDKRQFLIKNLGGQQIFPLSMLPGTGHKFVISAQKFYNNVEGLNQYKWLRMALPTRNGKTYKSMTWPIDLVWKRI